MSTEVHNSRDRFVLLLKVIAALLFLSTVSSQVAYRRQARICESETGPVKTRAERIDTGSEVEPSQRETITPLAKAPSRRPVLSPESPRPIGGFEPSQHAEGVRSWAESDLRAAAAWAEQLPKGTQRRAALEQVAIVWSNLDLQGAARWLKSLPEDAGLTAATLALGYESARTNPALSLDMLGRLAPSKERDEALAHAISQWACTDFNDAVSWAMNVPDPALKSRLLAATAVAAAEDNAAAAADLAARNVESAEDQSRAAVAIVQRWVQTGPELAAGWVMQFPDSPVRTAAIGNLFSIWALSDAAAAKDYLSRLPQGTWYDSALAAMRTVVR